MLNMLVDYWWIAVPVAAIVVFYLLRHWAEGKRDDLVEAVLRKAQSGFAKGVVDIHSITCTGTKLVDGETATLYDIDAAITPSDEQIQWAGTDLFLCGIDEDGDKDRMRVGEVRQIQKWNGTSFQPIKKSTRHEGTQRVKLSIRYSGKPGPTRFNYNFACFGPVLDLPQPETVS